MLSVYKNLASKDKIHCVKSDVLQISNKDNDVQKLLENNNYVIGSFFLSNLYDWLKKDEKEVNIQTVLNQVCKLDTLVSRYDENTNGLVIQHYGNDKVIKSNDNNNNPETKLSFILTISATALVLIGIGYIGYAISEHCRKIQ